jgi:hypothetical protein
VYSSKSATSLPGGSSSDRREAMNRCVCGDVSSAYTWSPRRSIASGHVSVERLAIRMA